MIIHTVFFLCSFTSVVCAVLLFRSYRKSKSRLLLWSSLCFAALALSNSLLFVDLSLVTSVDLSLYRHLLTFAGLVLLLYGLVMDSQMKTADLVLAISGAIFVLAGTIGLHFWKFWMKTGDRLFVYFALAFWVFALERCLLIGMALLAETHPTVYVVRLASFIFIAAGIIDKNRAKLR